MNKTINLALQGGGAHGAYTWGVLDYLLEEGSLIFDAISATSAGSMNAVVLAQGLIHGENQGAREALDNFWHEIAKAAKLYSPYKSNPFEALMGNHSLENSFGYVMSDLLTKVLSPYLLNPLNFNPIKEILEQVVNFDELRNHHQNKVHLKICATNVETGQPKIFDNKELSADAIMASACLPFLFQAVEIDGEFYWDGGYMGNPAIYPIIYGSNNLDVLIIHVNPIVRKGVPKTSAEILNRINEISFNSSLVRELRAIKFVGNLIDKGIISENDMKKIKIHAIRDDKFASSLELSSKYNCDINFLLKLKAKGRANAESWLKKHFKEINVESSVDIVHEYLDKKL